MDYLLTMPHDYMMSGYVDLPWWGYTLVALAFTHITIASVTIFLHRHQAHRALDLHPLALRSMIQNETSVKEKFVSPMMKVENSAASMVQPAERKMAGA